MKNQIVSVRLSPEIINGIDEFQRKHNLEFRSDALTQIVKIACFNVGIDLSDIPAAPQPQETQQASEERGSGEWLCPQTNRISGYERCERKLRAQPEECEKWYNNLGVCKAVPKYYWSILFPGEAEEAKEKEAEEEPKKKPEGKPITQKETATPPHRSLVIHETQIAPKPTPEKRSEPLRMGASEPQEPSVDQPGMKVSKTDVDPDIEVQPATIIKTLRERSVSKPKTRGQQTLGDDTP